MTYRGHVANGVIVLDDSIELDDGTEVVIEPVGLNKVDGRARFEHYKDLIGSISDDRKDLAENHDLYLRKEHGA